MLRGLSNLLYDLELEDSILVDYFAFRLRGYDVVWDRIDVNLVVDKDRLTWEPRDMNPREISLLGHPKYPLYERFVLEYGYPLHLIPETSSNMEGLYDQFIFSTGERLNVVKPVRNIEGFAHLIRQYCELAPTSFSPEAVQRWTSNIRNVKSSAEKMHDYDLVKACVNCEKQLELLYSRCLS